LSCPASASAGQCSFPSLVQSFSPPVVGSGGAACTGAASDGGVDDGGGSNGDGDGGTNGGGGGSSKSCGCATIGAEPASYAGALAIAGIAALFARKRRKK
jgi:MYXO-CTERM domain-containing protein